MSRWERPRANGFDVYPQEISKTIKRDVWLKRAADGFFCGPSFETGKDRRDPFAPGFLDGVQYSKIIINHHVMVCGVASTNVAKLVFFMDIN